MLSMTCFILTFFRFWVSSFGGGRVVSFGKQTYVLKYWYKMAISYLCLNSYAFFDTCFLAFKYSQVPRWLI